MKPPTFRTFGSPEAFAGAKPGDTIRIGNLPVMVATPEEAETAEFVVCIGQTSPLTFQDNETGPCRDCGDPLQWRPHAPRTPPRLCMDCALVRVLRAEQEATK